MAISEERSRESLAREALWKFEREVTWNRFFASIAHTFVEEDSLHAECFSVERDSLQCEMVVSFQFVKKDREA